MASPSDSTQPTTPTASSPITGVSALWTWLKNIGDWIKALSPNGAIKYDTGWVSVSYTDTAKIGPYSGGGIWVRRIGKQVYLRGMSSPVAAGSITSTAGIAFATLPAEFTPSLEAQFVCQGSGSERWNLRVQTSGTLWAQRYSGTQAANAWLPHFVSWAVD